MGKSKFYTEKELLAELKEALSSIGGVIDHLDFNNHIVKVDIDPDYEDEAFRLIENIIEKYSVKREEVLRNNPFCGVYDLIENLERDT